jgi:phosphoglycerate dehydrogenase-like enzyme
MASQLRVHVENSSSIGPLFAITPDMMARAQARRPAVRGRWTATYGTDLEGFQTHVESADVLLGWQFPHRKLGQLAPRLSWIQLTGAGVDHLLPLDWLPPRVMLTNARGAHKPKIGEALLMAILMINNFIPALAYQQRQHRWNQLFATGIAGKTLLIVGLGEAGGSAAALAKRFGMTVLATARRGTTAPEVDEVHAPDRLHALLPRADVVLITLPLTPDTRGLIGAAEIARMKTGAGLVNLSRCGVVDDQSLMSALRAEKLSGCVYDLEDPAHRPFDEQMWTCPNLVLLPHSQTNDPETFMDNVLDIFFENLERRLDDRPLSNVVDPVLGY